MEPGGTPFPLSVLKGGINRLRVKGGADPSSLYALLNARITVSGTVEPRDGTIREAMLDDTTAGLVWFDDAYQVFSNSLVSVPMGFVLNVLQNPTNPADTIVKIWFASPFMGFLYVVAEFASGFVQHYWLQSSGAWSADTVYQAGSIVTPTDPNGLAYLATRVTPVNSKWAPETSTPINTLVEPTVANGYFFTATDVEGDNPHTGETEPTWPSATGGTVQEFGDYALIQTPSLTEVNANPPLSTQITDRYGDSSTIAGNASAGSAGAVPTLPNITGRVGVWAPGTIYPTGSIVRPTTNQGAFVNAIPNGDFADGDDGSWDFSGTGEQWAITNSQGFAPGTGSAFIAPGSTSAFLTMDEPALCAPGQSVTAGSYMKTGTSGPTDLLISCGLNWYSDTGGTTLISSVDGGGKSSGGGWIQISVTAKAPPGTKSAKMFFHAASGTSDRDTGRVSLAAWNLETPAATSPLIFEAVQVGPGTSAANEPTWPTTDGETVVDNTVTWQAVGSSIITWTASPIMESGDTEPTWPTVIGESIADGNMAWTAIARNITDPNCPQTKGVVTGASKVFAIDKDIVAYSATVDPTDWSSSNNAGYIPTGLNIYGNNPMEVLGLYRGNLIAMNSGGYQMWQIDPDPANFALLDGQPVGSTWTRSLQSVANDTLFLTILGVRNIGTTGATANLNTGMLGQPVDPIVRALVKAGTYDPISFYYPAQGQYWLIFGPQVVVFTVNGSSQKSWSLYVFPSAITDVTLSGEQLTFRCADGTVQLVDPDALEDDVHTIANGITVDNHQATGPEQSVYGFGNAASCTTFNIGREGLPTSDWGSFTGALSFGTPMVCCTASDGFSNGDFYLVVDGGEAGAPAQSAFTSLNYISPRDSVEYSWNTADATFTQNGTQSCWAWDLGAHFNGIFGSTIGALIPINFVGGGGGSGGTGFNGIMQWPYLDLSRFGLQKEMVGFDIVGTGQVTVQFGFDQTDLTSFSDNPDFDTSPSVTAPVVLEAADTLPGEPIAMPLNAASYSMILTWGANQKWSWQASQLYALTLASAG